MRAGIIINSPFDGGDDGASPGEGDIVLDFSESETVRNIFSNIGALQLIYTVQILPRTDQDSVEVFIFEHQDHRFLSSISIFRKE